MSSPDSALKRLQKQFAGHLRDPEHVAPPEGLEDRRLAIYRNLFFNNIQGLLANNFPVLRKLYSRDAWRALVRDFYVRHRAHTPLFPELPREFLVFVQDERGPAAGDPPFLAELAHYEWAELALSLDEKELPSTAHPDGDLIEGRPLLSPLAWRLSYRYPVHRIRADFRPEKPPAEPTHLVLYRDAGDRVHFMQLNAVSARLIDLLEAHSEWSGRDALEALATEMQRPLADLVEPGRSALEELRKRQIILGIEG